MSPDENTDGHNREEQPTSAPPPSEDDRQSAETEVELAEGLEAGDVLRRLVRHEVQVVTREIRSEFHSGPLPHPDTLEAYNRIVPGCAQTIVAKFAEQSDHRRKMEWYALRTSTYRSFTGLGAGLVVCLAFLVASYSLIDHDHEVAGTILGTVDLVGLVSVFVYGSQALRKERIEKAKIMMGKRDEGEYES